MTQEIIVFAILAFAAAIVVYNTLKSIMNKIKASRAASKEASANACGGCTGCSISSISSGKAASAKSCH